MFWVEFSVFARVFLSNGAGAVCVNFFGFLSSLRLRNVVGKDACRNIQGEPLARYKVGDEGSVFLRIITCLTILRFENLNLAR